MNLPSPHWQDKNCHMRFPCRSRGEGGGSSGATRCAGDEGHLATTVGDELPIGKTDTDILTNEFAKAVNSRQLLFREQMASKKCGPHNRETSR
jgi:hypothetical protein